MKSSKSKIKGNSKPAAPRVNRNRESEIMTRGKITPLFEDLKDFIRSSAKGTETRVLKHIDEVKVDVKTLQIAVLEHTKMIKGLELKIEAVDTKLSGKIDSTEARLTEKIDSIHKRVDDHDVRIGALESAR